ncbi:MAG TPA: GNAT family N-acetyltransferase [Steroidobacteraceae bacterium]|nr:GNAT family N-acetyltransferase [Steroidobacteraceae bacterium]
MDGHSRRAPGLLRLRSAAPQDFALCDDIDTDAGMLFETAGLFLDLPDDHEFSVTERARWARCIAAGNVLLGLDAHGDAIGFAALGERDGQPYLQQLSVRQAHMRRGVGTRLLEAMIRAASLAHAAALWLTTYDHLPWNRAFYERCGFVRVAEADCGPELRRDLDYERRWLPRPECRIAMCRLLPRSADRVR